MSNSRVEEIREYDMEKPNLTHVQSVGGMTISPELFEKLYLTPKTPTAGDFRKRFANPTPLGFVGFVITDATFAMILMGWGGANSLSGVAGMFFFTGPVLLLLSTIFEWVQGNFFPMMVCGIFAVFWLSFGVLQLPSWGLAAAYSATGSSAEGAATVGYNAAIALYLLAWGFALLTFFVFTLKTNAIFALIFGFVTTASFILSAAYWRVAMEDYVMAMALQKAGGACLFVVALLGWYITFVMMAAEMRLTTKLPVGDLSHFWPATDISLNEMEKNV
ncbi:hypothetical protein MMC32_007006 [Xylographa parallela]|nr:hypothetical protein [Xylographa parallela]